MVVGWQLKKLVNTLKENKKEVILTLKKRPCHVDLFGNKPHKKKRVGNKLQPGTYPGKARSRRSRKSRRSPLQLPINTEPNTEALSDRSASLLFVYVNIGKTQVLCLSIFFLC